jgi:hypothetical protein
MRFRLLIFLSIASVISAAEAATAEAPSEVTVTANRLKLEQRVSNFVYGITALENHEGIARWHAPVCPSVTGLSGEQGEFLLERVSQIARDAGVPLAGKHCRPNLFIFVTAQPKQLLQAMENRYSAVSFGNATPLDVDEFIDTPRPVRVWHGSYLTQPGGAPPSAGVPTNTVVTGGNMLDAPTYHTPGNLGPSRLASAFVWTFSSVYVVADEKELRGVSQEQFADYVGMVSFAEIKTTAHFGDVQTILKLFDVTAQETPLGMSDWDKAYLKSLYGTLQESRNQRSLMTHSMARDLVP